MWLRLGVAYAAALVLAWPWAIAAALSALCLPRPRRATLGDVAALALALCLGHQDRVAPTPPLVERAVCVQGWIGSPPEGDARRMRAWLEVEAIAPLAPGAPRRVQLSSRSFLPPYGTRVVVHGRLRAARPQRHFVPGGEAAWLAPAGASAILDADSLRRRPGGAGPAWRRAVVEPIRAQLAAELRATLAPREAALLAALVVGTRDGLDAATRDAWAALGVNHILSISGMHVALVAGAVLALGGNPRRRRGLVFLLVAVWGYTALGGLGPTVLRASLMTTWAAIAVHLGRARRPLRGLGLASLVLVLQMPARRHDLGLQLSCLSTAGLLAASPGAARLAEWFSARGRAGRVAAWVAASAALGLAAQAATLPLQLWQFGAVSWISPVANLILVPLSDAALVLALGGAPLSLFCESLGRPLLLVAGGLTWVGCELAAWASGHCELRLFAHVDAASVIAASVTAGAALTAAFFAGAGGRRRAWGAGAVGLAAAIVLCVAAARPSSPAWQLEALDVGQGDGLVVTVGDATWVVDTGDAQPIDAGARVLVPHLRRAGIRHLRGVVLSHPHRDHCGGAVSLLRALPPDTLYLGRASADDSLYARLRATFPRVPVRWLAAGATLALAPDYTATVLWPESTDVLRSGANGCSVVLWARGGGHPDLFLMGDLEADGEARLLERWGARLAAAAPDYVVLKAGHHGSNTSSGAAFLAACAPQVAVVSVGAYNRYGHPGRRTLAALAACGAAVLRTDQGGAVRLLQRGGAAWLERPGRPLCALPVAPVDAAWVPP